jgi:predicted ATP-dependent endonuclease of OLD family
MRLKQVLVQNYRSTVDSTTVDIEDGVTVVIGKNEQGKSTFLHAIKAFNTAEHFSPNDLPNHLRPALDDRKPADIPMVTLWFTLEPQDKKKLANLRYIEIATTIKAVKYYGNNYGFALIYDDGREGPIEQASRDLTGQTSQIKAIGNDLKTKLHAHSERLPTFASNKENIAQITAALTDARLTTPADADDLIRTFTTSIKVLSQPSSCTARRAIAFSMTSSLRTSSQIPTIPPKAWPTSAAPPA